MPNPAMYVRPSAPVVIDAIVVGPLASATTSPPDWIAPVVSAPAEAKTAKSAALALPTRTEVLLPIAILRAPGAPLGLTIPADRLPSTSAPFTSAAMFSPAVRLAPVSVPPATRSIVPPAVALAITRFPTASTSRSPPTLAAPRMTLPSESYSASVAAVTVPVPMLPAASR